MLIVIVCHSWIPAHLYPEGEEHAGVVVHGSTIYESKDEMTVKRMNST